MNEETIEKLAALKREERFLSAALNVFYAENYHSECTEYLNKYEENQRKQLRLLYQQDTEPESKQSQLQGFNFKPALNQFLADIKANYLKGEDELYISIQQFEKFISDKEISINSLDFSSICK